MQKGVLYHEAGSNGTQSRLGHPVYWKAKKEYCVTAHFTVVVSATPMEFE